MRSFRQLVENWPSEGLALHGTPYHNVESIRVNGLVQGHPYVCPLPKPGSSDMLALRENLERLVGSILFAGNYAQNRIWPVDPSKIHLIEEGDLPSIIIFRGICPFEFTRGYDDDAPLRRLTSTSKRGFRSWGKTSGNLTSEHFAGHVRITREEYLRFFNPAFKQTSVSRSGNDAAQRLEKLIAGKLVSKVLAELRKITAARQS